MFCSKVYCQGLLLDVVQRTRIFQDSKTFVDMTLKYEPGEMSVCAVNLDIARSLNFTILYVFLC